MLACRTCRIPLNAPIGCDLCNGTRQNLVVVGETEDERPSLSGVGAEVVGDLRLLLKNNRTKLKANPDDDDAADRLLALGNTLAKVLESARKLQSDGVTAVAQMSFTERAALFISWITSLPPAYREALRGQWDKFETEISLPVKEALKLHE